MKTYLLVYLGSALLALVITPVVIRIARRLYITDVKGLRYANSKTVSNIGGVAIFFSMMCVTVGGLLVSKTIQDASREFLREIIVLLSATSLIFFIGLIDDIRIVGVRARTKFLAQIVAAVAVCAAGIRIESVTVADWLTLDFGWFSWPLTIFWISSITTVVYLSDGLDGLAAGISAITCGVIAVFAVYTGNVVMAVLMLALVGSLTGFLFFNFNPAKIFLGDCGSLFLGFTIASSSVLCSAKSSDLVGLALPILALGIPIVDMIFLMLKRFLEGRSTFLAYRNRFHHRLIDLGLGTRLVVIVAYTITLLSAGLGLFMMVTRSIYSLIIFFSTLLMLLFVFLVIGSFSLKETLAALKTRFSTAHQTKQEKDYFEITLLRMHAANSFDSWWRAICEAADIFEFARVTIVKAGPGDKTPTHIWRRGGLRSETYEPLRISMPIPHLHTTGQKFVLEIEAPTENSLESVGRRVALFSRLVAEQILKDDKVISAQELLERTTSTKPVNTPVSLIFDDSLPGSKIRKFLGEVENSVDKAHSSLHSSGNKGVD